MCPVSHRRWTEKSHRGGNIETVKKNIKLLVDAYRRANSDIFVGISYHRYKYNVGEEMENMAKFSSDLGLPFLTSWGRTITIENTVQALRYLEKINTGRDVPFKISENGIDLNTMFPPANPEFIKNMENLHFHPMDAMKFFERWPVPKVCIIADVFTEIRHDGRVQLCAWTDDMRLTVGNYLEMTQEEISKKRIGHPLCAECLRYRLPLYFHIVDWLRW